MMINIVLLGAGSTSFTLTLVRDLILTKGMGDVTLSLVDIDKGRLDNAEAVTKLYNKESGANIKVKAFTERKEALVGANYIICAVKIGGYGPLEEERKIAGAHGYYRGIGDRVSCYYGGVGAYWQLRFLDELAKDIEAICPDAQLIETANPVFEGTNYITRYSKVKTVGVCHGHYCAFDMAEILGLEREHVTVEVIGFNHCTFLTDFRYKGADAYPILDRWIAEKSEAYWESEKYLKPGKLGFSPMELSKGTVEAYRLYGLLPIGDATRSSAPWWHNTDFETKKKWYGTGGGFDSEIGWANYLGGKDEQRDKIERCLHAGESLRKNFPLESSFEQHIPVIEAMVNDKYTRFTLNIPNNGCIDGIPDDVVVEIPAMVSARGVQGIKMPRLPARLMNLVILPRMSRMNIILEAYATGSRDLLVMDLMNDHRTKSYEQAKDLIDELLRQDWNKDADKHYRQ